MAVIRGCLGKVKSGATPDLVGNVTAFNFSEAAEEIDTSVMGSCTSSSEAGSVKTTGSITVYWDPADTGQGNFAAGSTVNLELYPEGDTTGDIKFTSSTAVILSRDMDTSVNGIVSQTYNFALQGAFTEAAVP